MTIGWKIVPLATVALAGVALACGTGYGLAVSAPPGPDVVNLRPGTFNYRVSGEFTRDGRPAMPPISATAIEHPLSIMRHQVTAAEYRRCADAKACPAIKADAEGANLPVVKTSWYDASAYAAWLSRETGVHWRLPTDEEWAYAAGDLFKDDILPESFDGSDPGRRALARYDREAGIADEIGKELRPVGDFGANENGLLDIAGNVWEWTDTCFARSALGAPEGAGTTVNCGVRVAEGRHRTYVTDFIRDPRVGGCAVGTPPAHLGFRLVRDDGRWRGLRPLLALAHHLFGTRA
jgi:formylglycine-generating enzyme required for sulfatase activity